MVVDAEKRLKQAVEHIKDSSAIDDRDRELLLEFDRRLDLHQYSDQRHEKLVRHCKILAGECSEQGPDELPSVSLADALEDRDAAEEMVRWINRTYSNEETQRDYRVALRMFGKRVAERRDDIETDDNGVPVTLGWISSSTSRSYKPKPDPVNMLDWEDDILPMIDATFNPRDAALIAVAWDSGARAGELLGLRVGDISDHKWGTQISLDGKTGQRSVTLFTAEPYLSQWLGSHPRRDDPTAPLWCKLQSGEEMTYQMARKIPRQAAEKAGVTKPVNFTNFRKSSASYLASKGVNQAVLEDHHGWTTGSDVASRYISVFADASDREVARAHGVEVIEEEETEKIAPVVCPRCKEKTPRTEPFCVWCHRALEHGADKEIEMMQNAERRNLLKTAKENPELLDVLEDAEPLVRALGGDPKIIDTARQFVEAAEDR